ncbi:MAG: primosomal protein N' [Chloroflexi bacterium]|nr:primosomal protein N' [Chloroflexota bacterium]
MTTFVEIAVNVPQVSGVFHYHLPEHLEGQIGHGCLVTVPFGRQTVQGVVLKSVLDSAVPETKAVISLLDPEPVVTPAQVELAQYISEHTLTPLASCLSLMLPPGLGQMADSLYQLTVAGKQWSVDSGQWTEKRDDELTDAQRRLLELLQERGPLRGRQIDHALPRKRWRDTAQALQRRGLVTSQAVLQAPTVKSKTIRIARLICSPEEAEARLDELGRKGSQARERREAMLRYLLKEADPVSVARLYEGSGGNTTDIKTLEQKGFIAIEEREIWRDPLESVDFIPASPPELTQDQSDAWEQIRQGIQRSAAGESVPPYLLYGVTGSGKTEIYFRAVDSVLELGKQVIILVPEIALTPQTVRRFLARFPGRVGLIHSRLSQGERYDTWRRARAGELSVVVGPRSALFTPFSNLGLIVVDECHDDSYYQVDPAPSYHAREVAAAYAGQVGAVCLMGSATPDVVSTHRAALGQWTALSLPDRILAHKDAVRWQMEKIQTSEVSQDFRSLDKMRCQPLEKDAQTIELPPVHVVDMRVELKAGNRSIFSQALFEALSHVLERGQQAILFINRRGMATYVFCRECGYSLKCPRCGIPLTFHVSRFDSQPDHALICHRCNYRRNMPAKCPECGGTKIRQYGTGTEKVEAEVRKLFPQARILRWDWGATRTKGAHDAILQQFVSHKADVLIGTQMLAKGLDLPLVTLVGVVLADVGLNFPDYRSGERVFQVLTQVAGRAGRSPLGGQVILQTFEPDHYVIQAAARHSYGDFYRQELGYRRKMGYPPFARLVRLEFRGQDNPQVEESAQKVARQIQAWMDADAHHSTEIIGPLPCFFARLSGVYRWQIVLRGPNPVLLLKGRPVKDCRIEVDPTSLL